MSDHKFERKYDRRVTLEDEKNRIIDFRDFSPVPPEIGIYDGELRYFKANKLWCEYIFGWLTWMQSVSFWPDAEDTNYHAIQQMMIFEEGIDPVLTSEDICEAIVCAADKIAKRLISGSTTGFSIDEDGNLVVGGGSEIPTIPDNPATPENEEKEARNGGSIGIAVGFTYLLQDLNEWFGVDNVEDMSDVAAYELFDAKYDVGVEIQIQGGIEVFWIKRTASDPVELNMLAMAEWLFCEGTTREEMAAFVIANFSSTHFGYLLPLIEGLSDEQIATWYNKGARTPSTSYRAYYCEPVATEEFTFNFALSDFPQHTTVGIHKHGHRLLIEASGKFTDTDNPGEERDFLYHKSAVGAITFEAPQINASGLVFSGDTTQEKVPYQASGNYRWTIDLLDNPLEDSAIIFGKQNGSFNLPNTSGMITVRVTDLGDWSLDDD